LKVRILGTGTSQGVPVIGCDCEICLSDNPKDKRLRVAVLIQINGKSIAIDCGPDFRQQILAAKLSWLDAILITHEHNDHIVGLDDVRPFNFMKKQDMPVFTTERVIKCLHQRFAYIFEKDPYPGAPMVRLNQINKDDSFEVEGIKVVPIEVMHGKLPVLGFRINDFAYLTDIKTIAEEEKAKLSGIHTLVVSALHHKEHHSHMNLEQALALIEELKPKRAFITHISHRMGLHDKVNQDLPKGVQLAFDGLEFEL
jgi:phosphoribosyl 1,2-cyclic phosphate phosphodiesterase